MKPKVSYPVAGTGRHGCKDLSELGHGENASSKNSRYKRFAVWCGMQVKVLRIPVITLELEPPEPRVQHVDWNAAHCTDSGVWVNNEKVA